MDNGLLNLLAIVSTEIFCLMTIPAILLLGTPKSKGPRQSEDGAGD
jgi:hypothetical protein